jgi:hypothetical protein
MMSRLKEILRSGPAKAIGLLGGAGALIGNSTFIFNLFAALADGKIDDAEFHSLLASASGMQIILLVAIVVFLKNHK